MKDIIELLQKERLKTVDALKQGEQQQLSYLQQIDKAIGWLTAIESNELDKVTKYYIHKLPDCIHSYPRYHLMVDYDYDGSDDPACWTEYKPNGQSLLLSLDDIVIKRKRLVTHR